MRFSAFVALAAASLGAVGTIFLFFGTYGLEPYGVAFWAGPDTGKQMEMTTRRNKRRTALQRTGLALLLASFVAEGIAAVLPV